MKRLLFIIVTMLLSIINGHAQEAGADHLYAILVNGGRNRLTNHERYWNDCAFLYRTLRQAYHVPKRQITVLMSDGGASYEDMLQAPVKAVSPAAEALGVRPGMTGRDALLKLS